MCATTMYGTTAIWQWKKRRWIAILCIVLIGSYVERHFLTYEIPKGSDNLALLCCVGLGLMLAWNLWLAGATVVPLLGKNWGTFATKCILALFALIVWPMIIRKSQSSRDAAMP